MSFNSDHYNKISDAWIFIMGNNLHYGYFNSPNDDLNIATNNLIDKLSSLLEFTKKTNILDIGCGVGNPAFYLHKKYKSKIHGISISERGIDIANKKCKSYGFDNCISFSVDDATDNKQENNKYDIAWVMESSHLMRNKKQLFTESYRTLKDGGSILLCDIVLKKELNLLDFIKMKDDLGMLENAFGKAKMETINYYSENLLKTGFSEIETFDISKNVIPTLYKWLENTNIYCTEIINLIGETEHIYFQKSCSILINYFENNILGYAMIKGKK